MPYKVPSHFSYAVPFPLSIPGHTLYSRFTPRSLRWVGHRRVPATYLP